MVVKSCSRNKQRKSVLLNSCDPYALCNSFAFYYNSSQIIFVGLRNWNLSYHNTGYGQILTEKDLRSLLHISREWQKETEIGREMFETFKSIKTLGLFLKRKANKLKANAALILLSHFSKNIVLYFPKGCFSLEKRPAIGIMGTRMCVRRRFFPADGKNIVSSYLRIGFVVIDKSSTDEYLRTFYCR